MSVYVDYLIDRYKVAIRKAHKAWAALKNSLHEENLVERYERAIQRVNKRQEKLKKSLNENVQCLFLDSLSKCPNVTNSAWHEQVAGIFLADMIKGLSDAMQILGEANNGNIEYFRNMDVINRALPKYEQIAGVEERIKTQLELCDVACKGLVKHEKVIDSERFDIVASIVASAYQLTRLHKDLSNQVQTKDLSNQVQTYVKEVNTRYDAMAKQGVFPASNAGKGASKVADSGQLYPEISARVELKRSKEQGQTDEKAADKVEPETSNKDTDDVDQM